MTSSIDFPRRWRADCSPMVQRIASTMFDLPHPFGPTTAVTSWSKTTTVLSTNDLKPQISTFLIFMGCRGLLRYHPSDRNVFVDSWWGSLCDHHYGLWSVEGRRHITGGELQIRVLPAGLLD